MPIQENPLTDAMRRVVERASAVLNEQETEAKRREEIIEIMGEINDDRSLRDLLANADARGFFTAFGTRENGMTEAYGIPLIGSTEMPEMLAFTDKGVEYMEGYEGMNLADEEIQTHNICDHVSFLRTQEDKASALLERFFHGAIGSMTPDDFKEVITNSLNDFADRIANN